jgi:hypothetical protein
MSNVTEPRLIRVVGHIRPGPERDEPHVLIAGLTKPPNTGLRRLRYYYDQP